MAIMQLSKCAINTRARLVSADIAPEYRLRFQELGLRNGIEFHVTNKAAFGGVVINVAGTRIAVDRRSARNMDVEVAA